MEFATSSDHALNGVLYLILAFFAASAGSLLFCYWMRLRRLRNQQHAERVETEWRQFCFQALMTDQLDHLPPMNQRDLYDVVEMWLQTFDRIRGADAAKGLVRLGEWLDLSQRLLPWLTSRTLDEKLLAIMALGAVGLLMGWVAVLLGQNIRPRHYDPLVDSLDAEMVRGQMARMAALVRQTAEALPSHEAFIARYCAAPAFEKTA